MFTIRHHQISIMVMFAVALHLFWASIVLIDSSALGATGVASVYLYIQPPAALAIVMATAALLAILALSLSRPRVVILLVPQQILLMMSAAGAVEAIWLGQYADGIMRPRAFIAADQMYSVLAALGHTAAITAHAIRVVR
jgi:hypothetical protein